MHGLTPGEQEPISMTGNVETWNSRFEWAAVGAPRSESEEDEIRELIRRSLIEEKALRDDPSLASSTASPQVKAPLPTPQNAGASVESGLNVAVRAFVAATGLAVVLIVFGLAADFLQLASAGWVAAFAALGAASLLAAAGIEGYALHRRRANKRGK